MLPIVAIHSIEIGCQWQHFHYLSAVFDKNPSKTQVGSPAVHLRLAHCTAWVKRWSETMDFLQTIFIKSKFYKKHGATFFYDITRKLGPLDFTQYRSKSSSF